MTTDTRYNGWTNYPTWRVYMEVFENRKYADAIAGEITPESLEEIAKGMIDMGGEAKYSTALEWAYAFISEVNWHEIAAHLNEQCDPVLRR